jgi:hypothetical protein
MWCCHIVTFRPPFDRQKLLDALDTMPNITNWRASTGAVFIVADESVEVNTIADQLIAKLPDLRFVVSTISSKTSQGFTDKDTWAFITDPKPVS